MFRSTMTARSRVFHRKSLLRLFSALLIVSMLVMPAGALAASGTAAPDSQSSGEKVIFFSSDGLRQDLVESFANQRLMPAMAKLLRTGPELPMAVCLRKPLRTRERVGIAWQRVHGPACMVRRIILSRSMERRLPTAPRRLIP